ncbi:hypothetical protein QQ045_000902 [Rhodiola kirilowii]
MLRNRSRAAVSSKQALVSDHTSMSSSTRDQAAKPISSFLGSPRFFGGFFTKGKGCEADALMSPTSTLDMKPVFPLDNPFGFSKNIQHSPRTSGKKRPWETSNSTAVGLALITSPDETPAGKQQRAPIRMVTFAPHLNVQIPTTPLPSSPPSPDESSYSPSDFGIKTRNQLLNSPNYQTRKPPVTTSRLSVAEMELSEDYTRVISHGLNPITTHIFDNCVIKSFPGAGGSSFTSAKTKMNFSPVAVNYLSDNFLSHCYTCKRSLSHKKDIYIYRGEKAFCSQACRAEEMLKDGADYPFMDDDALTEPSLRHCKIYIYSFTTRGSLLD